MNLLVTLHGEAQLMYQSVFPEPRDAMCNRSLKIDAAGAAKVVGD